MPLNCNLCLHAHKEKNTCILNWWRWNDGFWFWTLSRNPCEHFTLTSQITSSRFAVYMLMHWRASWHQDHLRWSASHWEGNKLGRHKNCSQGSFNSTSVSTGSQERTRPMRSDPHSIKYYQSNLSACAQSPVIAVLMMFLHIKIKMLYRLSDHHDSIYGLTIISLYYITLKLRKCKKPSYPFAIVNNSASYNSASKPWLLCKSFSVFRFSVTLESLSTLLILLRQ